MKKIYQTPALLVVKLGTKSDMLSLSFPGDGENGKGGVNDDDATDDGMVKGSTNIWDEKW